MKEKRVFQKYLASKEVSSGPNLSLPIDLHIRVKSFRFAANILVLSILIQQHNLEAPGVSGAKKVDHYIARNCFKMMQFSFPTVQSYSDLHNFSLLCN